MTSCAANWTALPPTSPSDVPAGGNAHYVRRSLWRRRHSDVRQAPKVASVGLLRQVLLQLIDLFTRQTQTAGNATGWEAQRVCSHNDPNNLIGRDYCRVTVWHRFSTLVLSRQDFGLAVSGTPRLAQPCDLKK